MSLCWRGVQRITQKAGKKIRCLGHDGTVMGGKLERGFSYPALVRSKMQRGCSTMMIHSSPVSLEGEKPAQESVVQRALKPTDARKGKPIKMSVGWPTFSKKRNRTTGHGSVCSMGNYSTKIGYCIKVQGMHACVHVYTYMCLRIYVHVCTTCPYLTV